MAPRALGEGGAVRTARGRNAGEEHGAWGQAGPRSRWPRPVTPPRLLSFPVRRDTSGLLAFCWKDCLTEQGHVCKVSGT